jgi:transposase
MVVHACNPSTEAVRMQVRGRPGLHSETLIKEKKIKKEVWERESTKARRKLILCYVKFTSLKKKKSYTNRQQAHEKTCNTGQGLRRRSSVG